MKKDIKCIVVALDQLKPFSGVLYDEKGNKTNVEGNSFYVPEDYLENNDKDSESIKRLHASIKQEGVLTPLLVRPSKKYKDAYEVLSGYRRMKVCEVLSKEQPKFREVPVFVIDCDDDDASSIITSANIQRREVSLLDMIISCGRMYRALRHRGLRDDKGVSCDIVADVLGLTPRTVKRYALLIDLPDFMLQLIGRKKKTSDGNLRLSIRAGERFFGINKAKLDVVNQIMQNDDSIVITYEMANKLRRTFNNHPEITNEEIEQIIRNAASSETEKTAVRKKRFSPGNNLTEAIDTYCHDMSDQQIDELLSELLKQWNDSADKSGKADMADTVGAEAEPNPSQDSQNSMSESIS